ncbi:uncharacterized protein LOC141671329 isoform X2 [Apium graveolens]|uniref:uncharacterized protein LOC141671329 isoform X2 n=1 Tax=Apium graveolens TaxID=4045 RepID=UPI003D7B366A
MSNTIKLCKFCRAEIRVPYEAQRGIQCPVCGNINNFGGYPLNRHYAANNENGPQYGGYQYHHPSLPPPRGPHSSYQQPWPPRASDGDYIEHQPPSRQGSFRPIRPNRYSYQSPPQASPRPMYYQSQSPRRSSHPTYSNGYYQPQLPPPERPSHPLIKVNSIDRPLLQTSQPQGYRRPLQNGYYQQPSQVSSQVPMDDEDYYYQNQTVPQAHRPIYENNNGYNEQEAPPSDDYYQQQLQTSPPRVQTNGYYRQPLRTPQPQSISHVARPQVPSNGSYHRQPSRLESPAQQSSLPESQAQSPRTNGSNSQHFSQNQEESPAQPPPQSSVNGYNQQQSGRSSHIQQTSQAQPAYGRKRAVVCGVSYLGQKSNLEASISDARSVKDFLVKNMRFPDESIYLLTEAEVDPSRIPTRANILKALKWLVESCKAGDSLVFYYTGHGSKERDFDGDEIDGFDEVICPVDYQSAGKILDDEINATIVRPLPPGAKLHGIIDCCFSGTVLDLPFLSKTDSKGTTKWVDQRIQYAAYKGTSGGIAISISACTDHQKSGDTTAFTGSSTGALTYSFIQALTKQPNITYGNLLNTMRISITQVQERLEQPPQTSVRKGNMQMHYIQ